MTKVFLNVDSEQEIVFIYDRDPRPPDMVMMGGRYRDAVRPGDSALGLTYDELVALGTGEHEIGKDTERANMQQSLREPKVAV